MESILHWHPKLLWISCCLYLFWILRVCFKTERGEIIDVGNSVSLRSKRLLEIPKKIGLKWKSYYGNFHEDGFICVHNRHKLESNGIKFPKKELAYKFGIETFFKEYKSHKSFTFHKWSKNNKNYPNFHMY